MSVLKVYPHIITVTTKTQTDGYDDENGVFHKGSVSTTVEVIKCQATPATSPNNTITYYDGTVEMFSYIIIASRNCSELVKGQEVSLELLNGKKIGNLKVKDFYRYQTCTKIWL